ncbi:MAG: HAD family hydrolase [Desulfurella sp.]|nr:HAD hydrolase family protein [Desulfurella sp.]AHF96856.1 soluble P-type ATPase [Desulfurella acetivorans A63]PMP88782.1 MAG: ATPase P [Desulfurella sp.]HEX12987.1 ATPase P [Desulfurella acetivorans]
MEIEILSVGKIVLKRIILDFNGTLATSGVLIKETKDILEKLSKAFDIHIVTGDTFSSAKEQLKGLNVKTIIAPLIDQITFKLEYAKSIGLSNLVAIGNGKNDSLMLKYAKLGICVIGKEGANLEALQNSDIIVCDIVSALELLLYPKRLVATLRA